jgi:hypothetical protein
VNRIGRDFRRRQMRCFDKTRKQDADMRRLGAAALR